MSTSRIPLLVRGWHRLRAMLLLGLAVLAPAIASAQITAVASTTATANSNQITLTAPVGMAVGDVMLAFIAQRQGGALGTVTVPAGWTQVLARDNGNPLGVLVFSKVVGTADIAGSFAWTLDRSDRTAAGLSVFRGVGSTTPIDVSASQSYGASSTYSAPQVTTTVANTMLVAFFAAVDGNGSVNAAGGMTSAFSAGTLAGPNGVVVGGSYALQPAVGASGTKQSTGNASLAHVGALVALRPAGAVTLRADYRFDECTPVSAATGSVLDSSGNARHGTPFGVTSPSPAGRINRSLGLTANTTTDYAVLDPASINGLVDFSVSLWFRTGVTKSQQEILQALGTSSVNFDDLEIYLVNSNRIVVNVRDSADLQYTVSTPASLTDNAWHHLVVARRGGTVCLYIDGALVSCNGSYATTALTIQPGTFIVGQEQDGYATSFNLAQAFEGLIDEIKLYAGDLGAGAVATIFANESAGLNADGSTRSPDACGGPDHYELVLPSSSLTCLASPVTVVACSNASSPCTSPATNLVGRSATLATSAGTLASTTVTFNASGTASTTLAHPAAADATGVTVTLSGEQTAAVNPRRCCPDGINCVAANSCSTTFRTAGFVIATTAGGAPTTIPTQTAGTASGNFVLRAVRSSTSTAACEAALTGTTPVNWSLGCSNPATCSAGNRMTVTGNAPTAIAAGPASTAVSMTFDAGGNAPFSFNYADVGLVSLTASKAAGGPLLSALTGTSNPFVVRPAGFTVSGLRCTTYAAGSCATSAIASPGLNPAAMSATGSAFIQAGQPVTATVTAVDSAGNATPNYGRETSAEGVLLTPSLVAPAAGVLGTVANPTIAGGAFSGGVATVSNLSYSEVGIIRLTPSVADGNYLGAGNVTGTASVNVGRFIPARFALSGPAVTHRDGLTCTPASSFSYLGETFALGFALTAQNTAGATTLNYAADFAKLDPTLPTAWSLVGRDGSTLFTTASGRLALGSSAGTWSSGVANVTLRAAALRGSTPDGPFSADFGIAPVDSDGAQLASYDMASTSSGPNDRARLGTLPLRFGRLLLLNAIGAPDRPLAMSLVAQSWNGTAFADNTLDSCTTVPAAAVSFGNLRGTLTTADTTVGGAATLTAGRGQLLLAAPGGGRSGSVDLALSLGTGATDASCLQPWTPPSADAATAGANLTYLRGAWCGASWDRDPAARATFGRMRGSDALLYRRENF